MLLRCSKITRQRHCPLTQTGAAVCTHACCGTVLVAFCPCLQVLLSDVYLSVEHLARTPTFRPEVAMVAARVLNCTLVRPSMAPLSCCQLVRCIASNRRHCTAVFALLCVPCAVHVCVSVATEREHCVASITALHTTLHAVPGYLSHCQHELTHSPQLCPHTFLPSPCPVARTTSNTPWSASWTVPFSHSMRRNMKNGMAATRRRSTLILQYRNSIIGTK